MTPKPYSEKSSLPNDSSDDVASGIPTNVLPETPSPETLSAATTPSPTPQELPVETFVETVVLQDTPRVPDLAAVTPCYPTPGDIMPYDHSLPDFIRQITNQPNLANLQKLSLRVISTLISLHRMSTYLPNLRELDLEGSVLNSLRDIGCSLKNLQVLKVGRCQLESLDGTFGISSLRELYAQKNFINDVSPCSNLPHIRHIDVSGNRIRNISYAGFLSVCNKLKSIVFTGNPATEASDYRKHVRRILPQIESLDGIPFNKEDDTEEVKESDIQEDYYCNGSDISSEEFPDFSAVDSYSLEWEQNKETKIQPELSPKVNTNQLQSDYQEPNLLVHQGKKVYLEEEENTDNRNTSSKQKYTNIQKLDKDMVNHSKKTNLLKTGNFGQEFASSSEISKYSKDSGNISSMEDDLAAGFSSLNFKSEEVCGTIKKRPSSVLELKQHDEDQNRGVNKLTTGLPVCGNLTAALRNRKKILTISQNKSDDDKTDEIFDSGDNVDYLIPADMPEDSLFTSKKWKESLHRPRSTPNQEGTATKKKTRGIAISEHKKGSKI